MQSIGEGRVGRIPPPQTLLPARTSFVFKLRAKGVILSCSSELGLMGVSARGNKVLYSLDISYLSYPYCNGGGEGMFPFFSECSFWGQLLGEVGYFFL